MLNPISLNVWIFGGALGFAIHGNSVGGAVGLAVASGLTLAVSLFLK